MQDFPEFILASKSLRRSELLKAAGYRFQAVSPPLEEPPTRGGQHTPAQLAEALAFFKASCVHRLHSERIVVGADTVVAIGQEVFGKADDESQARAILSRLAGSRHAVITGVAILMPESLGLLECQRQRLLVSETTYVTMRALTRDEIEGYIASGEWRDKAGAYAIQDIGDAFIEGIQGSFSNVVGLPMELIEHMFARVRPYLVLKRESK
jgi:septum formation protein